MCVTFWQNTQRGEIDRNRLSVNYCMKKCDERSDCRDDEGYSCLRGSDFGFDGEATVEGDANQHFCAVRLPATPASTPDDANMSQSDSGAVGDMGSAGR